MSVGCLAASSRRTLIESVIPLLPLSISLACAVLVVYTRVGQVVIDVGGQGSPQQIYFGAASQYDGLRGIRSMFEQKLKMPSASSALKGRAQKMPVPDLHHVLGSSLEAPFPANSEQALFGLGCFWGAEKKFWQLPGIHTTAAGYAAGLTPNPTYREVCSGETGHNEVVLVVFDPRRISYDALLKTFWESHNPTQGMRQGNDTGTQYRSGIYYDGDEQRAAAERSRDEYQRALSKAGHGAVTTEILPAPDFYYAEDYHQQYLSKNPDGYCGLGGTGVACPAGVTVA